MKKHAANIITAMRFAFGLMMLIFPAFSAGFYILYLLGGITDMVDGTVARKTGSQSTFGSKLDTAADFVFFLTAAIKLFPKLDIPKWLIVWIILIVVIKAFVVVLDFVRFKKLVTHHTAMNKITGTLLFILPLTLSFLELKYSATAVCLLATIAAVESIR